MVVNFSYFVFIMVENSHNRQAEEQPKTEVVAEQNDQNSQSGVVKNENGQEEVVVREESISRYSRQRSGRSNVWATEKGRAFMWLDMLYYVGS